MAERGDPQLPWTTIISVVGLLALAFGGEWAVTQTQFGYIEKDKATIREELVRSLNGIQEQFKLTEEEFATRRTLNVEQVEFKQFEKRIDTEVTAIRERLTLIEQTRPTTGELRGIADNADKQIAHIQDRLDHLEKRSP